MEQAQVLVFIIGYVAAVLQFEQLYFVVIFWNLQVVTCMLSVLNNLLFEWLSVGEAEFG